MKEKKKVKHRVCPHCGKTILPKPKKIVWHWKTFHCGCVGESSKLTDNKDKVSCCNCQNLIREVEDGLHFICDCGYVIERQRWKRHKFCPDCGKNIN